MIATARRPRLLPRGAERHLLGRFYTADFVAHTFDVVLPFQFVYLYLVLDWSEWAALPFVLHSALFLLLELTTGIWADRYSRKRVALAGEAVAAFALASVPLAASLQGGGQLVAVCAVYVLMGFGESLRSGSGEAWAVDNLLAARRPDLLEIYFGRTWSLTSAGGVVAGVLAILLMFILPVSRALINCLWIIAAVATLASVAVIIRVPENTPADEMAAVETPVAPTTEREDVALSTDAATAAHNVWHGTRYRSSAAPLACSRSSWPIPLHRSPVAALTRRSTWHW